MSSTSRSRYALFGYCSKNALAFTIDMDVTTSWYARSSAGLQHAAVAAATTSRVRSGIQRLTPGEGDHLLRAIAHVVGGRQRETRVGEHLLAQLHVRPLHPDHDRQTQAELLDRRDHAGGEPVAAQDPAEDVDEHRLHARIGGEDAERVFDLLGGGAAADVEEVGGLAAGELHDVHRRHGEAGPVDHAADVAVELDVVQPIPRRLDVERLFLVDVAQGDDVLVAPQGAVVEAQLGVERQHPPVLRDDKG